ncbi:uncharacterized protein LOC126655692 [Mercurialis annua]|uniref:uncharacterized protein LOC126655692 n=1 Tax=Mercurialis annua TaxID=3986 RepID=UPI00215E2883|nr:uncharacterized protein LOC126655692 [Mercurialis annua]
MNLRALSFANTVTVVPSKQETLHFMENQTKPRILCLHGYRTSGSILQKMIERWPETVLEKLHLHFLDGPFPARGKSDVERVFDPPYFEWYHASQDYKEYVDFDESVAYIEDHMIKHGPFDGVLGFSQGAILSSAMPGMQAQGMAFTRVPKIKFVILISGIRFLGYKYGKPKLAANAFSSPIQCPSLHFIGERDFLKEGGKNLVKLFVDPVVIHHPMGHVVPKLDESSLKTMLSFIKKIQPLASL